MNKETLNTTVKQVNNSTLSTIDCKVSILNSIWPLNHNAQKKFVMAKINHLKYILPIDGI